MIGKVIRGTNVGHLLHYLYGPGKANEHTDPHLVAGFGDPAELEPSRRTNGSWDLRRLTGLLIQPLAALDGSNYSKPVWHCSVRAAPGDRTLSDAEWAQVADQVMHRTGLAPHGDDLGVRWVAVRHAPDHIHLVATLARQDGVRPKVWNDFFRVREACREAERWFGLAVTAPADRTAARRSTRAETEQTARRCWPEPPRVTLRREVCTAAAGARTEQEFFTQLAQVGVQVRYRRSTTNPDHVTGYAVSLPQHTTKDGHPIWYSGGKLAADLTLPKLRSRWRDPQLHDPLAGAEALPDHAIRAVLRTVAYEAAHHATSERDFFERLRASGLLVRYRYSELDPGHITGYAVTLPGCTTPDGTSRWYSGNRLAEGLTLPRLRNTWAHQYRTAERDGTPGFTDPDRAAIYEHTARQAAATADHLRRCCIHDRQQGADASWATADALHAAAKAFRSPMLRCVAATYDRAARTPYGHAPRRTHAGDGLRTAARLLAMAGRPTGDLATQIAVLITNLIALAEAVAELRTAQARAAQASAARQAARQLHSAIPQARPSDLPPRRPERARSTHPADLARQDSPAPLRLSQVQPAARPTNGARLHPGHRRSKRAGPGSPVPR
jgi:hypothetical protein